MWGFPLSFPRLHGTPSGWQPFLTGLSCETVQGQSGSSSAIIWDAHLGPDSPELYLKIDDCSGIPTLLAMH